MNKDNDTIAITTDQLLEGLGQLIRHVLAPVPKYLDTLLAGEYVLVRTYSAGVFAGHLAYKEGDEVELLDARRIWYWSGSASLSQMAEEGVKNPKDCKFPKAVGQMILQNVIEIARVTKAAEENIKNVPEWRAEKEGSDMDKHNVEAQKTVANDGPKLNVAVKVTDVSKKKTVKKVEPEVKQPVKTAFNKKPTRWKE